MNPAVQCWRRWKKEKYTPNDMNRICGYAEGKSEDLRLRIDDLRFTIEDW